MRLRFFLFYFILLMRGLTLALKGLILFVIPFEANTFSVSNGEKYVYF